MSRSGSIPAGHHELPLVVRVDESDEIAQHHAVFVAETGARQDHRGKPRIVEVNRQLMGVPDPHVCSTDAVITGSSS